MASHRSDNVLISALLVQLQHIHRLANREASDEEDEDEDSDVVDRFCNQSDIESGLFEQPQPIKDFNPEQKKDKGSNEPLVRQIREVSFEYLHCQYPTCANVYHEIDNVEERSEVLSEGTIDTLFHINIDL